MMLNQRINIIEKRVKRLIKNVIILMGLTIVFVLSVIAFELSKIPLQAVFISLIIVTLLGIVHRIGVLIFSIKSINRIMTLYK